MLILFAKKVSDSKSKLVSLFTGFPSHRKVKMINHGYHDGLKCWRIETDDHSACFNLNLPKNHKAEDVITEAERLVVIANTKPEPIVEPTLTEKLETAISEYIALGIKPEVIADKVITKMDKTTANAYLDQKSVDVKPEPKPDEKPAIHIRRDQKLALCEYFLGPYTWAFADVKQAQQEIDARGVVEICPKCLEIAGVKP